MVLTPGLLVGSKTTNLRNEVKLNWDEFNAHCKESKPYSSEGTSSGGLFSLSIRLTWVAALPKRRVTFVCLGRHAKVYLWPTESNNELDIGSSPTLHVGPEKGTTSFELSAEATPFNRDSSLLDPRISYDVESNVIKSVADFLAKPISVATGTFTTANVWGDNLYTGDIYTLFQAQNLWVNKIQGFLSFRADVKIRVVVNATPFQAGLLRVSYFPCGDVISDEAKSHRYNRMTTSQLPGTYLNLHDNAVEVTVPFMAPQSFLERDVAGSPSWGSLYIDVFEVLRTGTGPTTVNFTVWMSLENVELSGQTVPQMSDGVVRRRVRRVMPSDSESNDGRGPLTKILSSGATLASNISEIPLLSHIATPAFWALRAASAAAETLGWSKPLVTADACRFVLGNGQNQQNCDGGDLSMPLSLSADNKLAVITDASPDNMDEMSFKYIQSVWSYWFDFQWSSAFASGTLLSTPSLSPLQMQAGGVLGIVPITTIPPCALGAQFFQYYRGGFDLKVTVVKTGFHTGTLAISYLPGKTVVAAPAYNDTAYLYRSIIDIQDAEEFTFRFPYILPQEYIDTNTQIGQLVIHVVNPLLAPATVASTVDVMVQVKGAPDLQYQAPIMFNACPVVPQGFNTQEGGDIDREFGTKGADIEQVHHAQQTIGEYIGSVLSLLKAYYRLASVDNISFPLSTPNLSLMTHRYYGSRWDGTNWHYAELGGDPLSLLGACYAFSRGSIRYRLSGTNVPNTVSSYNGKAILAPSFKAYDKSTLTAPAVNLSANGTPTFSSGRAACQPLQNGTLSIQSPFYSKYRYMLNHFLHDGGTGTLEYTPNFAVTFDQNYVNATLSRAAGDDFQLTYFVGVPAFRPSPYGL